MRAVCQRARGAALFIFVVVFVGGALTGSLVYGRLGDFESAKKRRVRTGQSAVNNARESLITYMLARASSPLNIARAINKPIPPRLLMLPCPDNLGDGNLDGTQDPTCGADTVRGILNSGSRFGRLPYWMKFPELRADSNEVNDGLAADFRDAHGNRLWYAASQNLVPSITDKPLNLHLLDAAAGKWLSVVRAKPVRRFEGGVWRESYALATVESRAAAVVLAPGKHRGGRPAESFLLTASLNLGAINPELYFESRGGESNADADGVFVQSRPDGDFDDAVSYISLDELLAPEGRFMPGYRAYAGAGAVHNAPHANSPLAGIYGALADWKNFFGFYPPPAANTAPHTKQMQRHCAASRAEEAGAGTVAAGVEFILPAAAEITVSAATGITITVLRGASAVLAARAAAVSLAAPLSVVVRDVSTAAGAAITLARYARLTLDSGARMAFDAAALQTVSGATRLRAGAAVSLAAPVSVWFAKKTPLAPGGIQQGWFPEHHRTTMTAARDGAIFNLGAATAAGFLGEVKITSATRTITMRAGGVLTFPAKAKIKIEADAEYFARVSAYLHQGADAVYSENGNTIAIAAGAYKPTRRSFLKRNFAVLVLSDSTFGARGRTTVYAPMVVYPWRTKTSASARTITRDNLHPYPPCFDSRNMRTAEKTFIANQNIYYAVSPDCGYGSPARCGNGGFTISAAAGTQFAAAAAFTLSHTFTATVHSRGGVRQIAVSGGKAADNLTLARHAVLRTDAKTRINLTAGFSFAAGQPIVIPAGARITAGDRTRVENAEAVLIYSPAPADNVRCARNMPPAAHYTAGTLTLAIQGGPGADLTIPCQWLDDDENADGDLQFTVRPPQSRAPAFNDFFMYFGGRVRID